MANVIALAFILAVVVVLALELGYRCGVRETERRWSEAVNRAEAHRKQENPR